MEAEPEIVEPVMEVVPARGRDTTEPIADEAPAQQIYLLQPQLRKRKV